MALITCQECKASISNQIEACPHCGYPVAASQAAVPAADPPSARPLLITMGIFNLVMLIWRLSIRKPPPPPPSQGSGNDYADLLFGVFDNAGYYADYNATCFMIAAIWILGDFILFCMLIYHAYIRSKY